MSLLCNSCNLTYNYVVNNLCVMCQTMIEPTHQHTYSYIICNSDISQLDIIKKTRDFVCKHNRVPLPNEIDTQVKIIKVNPYEFIKISKLTNYFKNFKIFFTDDLNIKLIKTFRIFDKIIKNKKDLEHIPTYSFTSDELNEFNIYKKIYKDINQKILSDLFDV